ncbi:MAG: hypothetical protein KAJ19_02930 [Gammaproteobacteria bacterium]|nr:hypothetical protein [Gammaproteobacteria bacterium]
MIDPRAQKQIRNDEFIKRLKAGERSDNFNADIMAHLGYEIKCVDDLVTGPGWYYKIESGIVKDCWNPVWNVTRSVDAALALFNAVLPGWEWGIDWFNEESEEQEQLAWVRKELTLCEGRAETPAAAIVIAILEAKGKGDD